jgi:hypothetical protein
MGDPGHLWRNAAATTADANSGDSGRREANICRNIGAEHICGMRQDRANRGLVNSIALKPGGF